MPRTKSNKSKRTKTKTNRQLTILFTAYTCLLVVLLLLVIWAMVKPRTTSSAVAAPQQIEQAKSDIAQLFADRAVEHCPHPDLPQFKDNQNGYVIDYRYLRFNKQANRAIISSCNNADTLLAKTSTGKWIETNVNITINNRVNPVWQKECMIEDITVADSTIRPENSSIDQFNLEECAQIKQM